MKKRFLALTLSALMLVSVCAACDKKEDVPVESTTIADVSKEKEGPVNPAEPTQIPKMSSELQRIESVSDSGTHVKEYEMGKLMREYDQAFFDEDAEGQYFISEYVYTGDLISQIITTSKSGAVTKTTYSYDNGHISKIDTISEDTKYESVYEYEYEDDKLVSRTYTSDDERRSYTEYFYDDDGYMIRYEEVFSPDGKTRNTQVAEYTYDENGYVNTITIDNGDPTIHKVSYENDADGNILTMDGYHDDYNHKYCAYEYDDHGNMVSSFSQELSFDDEGQTMTWENLYDSNGRLLSVVGPNDMGEQATTTYYYFS